MSPQRSRSSRSATTSGSRRSTPASRAWCWPTPRRSTPRTAAPTTRCGSATRRRTRSWRARAGSPRPRPDAMCGIGGCVAPPGARPDEAALQRMAAALGHRGPDDSGVAIRDNVGLVHTRLAIVDPTPAGHQPMQGPRGWSLTYNGEVFNHAELRAGLENGSSWRSGTDTETLLALLERDGDAAIERLNGLFAFAAC